MFKVLFFDINILRIAVIFFDTPKIIKVLFSLFPHIAKLKIYLFYYYYNLLTILILDFIFQYDIIYSFYGRSRNIM